MATLLEQCNGPCWLRDIDDDDESVSQLCKIRVQRSSPFYVRLRPGVTFVFFLYQHHCLVTGLRTIAVL